MGTKEVKIEIPEGYEIDEVRSSFTKIVFKRKITKPRSWDEYLKEGNHPSPQYYINPLTGVKRTYLYGCCGDLSGQPDSCKMYLPTRELADKFLVYMQLMSLYKAWIGDWNNTLGHCIRISVDGTILVTSGLESTPLRFPTKEMALEFRACFKHLLEQAKGLY